MFKYVLWGLIGAGAFIVSAVLIVALIAAISRATTPVIANNPEETAPSEREWSSSMHDYEYAQQQAGCVYPYTTYVGPLWHSAHLYAASADSAGELQRWGQCT